ncbi:MAG: transposase family protein [Leptolyngbyaceae cyanobacterium SM2_5_2]|nr:transposase family protein [Leptolyngbyaceae cyanobacterium SM2_5_2]
MGLEERVLLTLEFWREYRTYFHMGNSTLQPRIRSERLMQAIQFNLQEIYSKPYYPPG